MACTCASPTGAGVWCFPRAYLPGSLLRVCPFLCVHPGGDNGVVICLTAFEDPEEALLADNTFTPAWPGSRLRCGLTETGISARMRVGLPAWVWLSGIRGIGACWHLCLAV